MKKMMKALKNLIVWIILAPFRFVRGIFRFFINVFKELRKVQWLKFGTLMKYSTIVVSLLIFFSAVFLFINFIVAIFIKEVI